MTILSSIHHHAFAIVPSHMKATVGIGLSIFAAQLATGL